MLNLGALEVFLVNKMFHLQDELTYIANEAD